MTAERDSSGLRIVTAAIAIAAALCACSSSQGVAGSSSTGQGGASSAAQYQPAISCTDLVQQLSLPDTTISSVELDSGGTTNSSYPDAGPEPENCVVEGEIGAYSGVTDPNTGSDQYGVKFELRMPTSWNGRFFYQGGGGTDGEVLAADGLIPSQAGSVPAVQGFGSSAQTPALWRGFAVVSTDAGHDSSNLESGFGVDPQARINYGYASIGLTTAVAKQIIETYYGQAPLHSYFLGCSKGGQEAMQAMQKYGAQFDGIVAGDPGFHLPHASIGEVWNTQALAVAARANAPLAVDLKGDPLLYYSFSTADLNLIVQGVLKACDALDGVADNMIFNTQACIGRFNLASLLCSGKKTASCLSQAQVTAAQAVFGGAKDKAGNALYAGFPYDSGISSTWGWPGWDIGTLPVLINDALNTILGAGSAHYIFSTPPASSLDIFTLDIDAYAQSIYATSGDYTVSAVDFMEATSTDLSAFAGHGGKIIIYHGESDPVFSMYDTIAYYNALVMAYGSGAQNPAELFLVPGMNHCAGGDYAADTFDTLDAIVDWVENGQAPTQLIAAPGQPSTSKLPAGTTRPLCPYPQYASYQGGDVNDASSYACAAPAS